MLLILGNRLVFTITDWRKQAKLPFQHGTPSNHALQSTEALSALRWKQFIAKWYTYTGRKFK